MNDIRSIYGIGEKKANDLKKYYNIRTIYGLRKYIRKIPNIINDSQKIGIKYHNKIYNRVSYKSIEKHVNIIKKLIPGAIIAGSFRRKESKIRDIDVIITSNLKKVVDKLKKNNYIVSSLVMGDEKFSGIVRLPNTENYRRIDILKTTIEEKPFALLYFTGSVKHNIIMRQHSKKKGYSLSQHGLKKINSGKMVRNIKTERDIFNFIDMKYINPEDRI